MMYSVLAIHRAGGVTTHPQNYSIVKIRVSRATTTEERYYGNILVVERELDFMFT
jgi:hypothetical protein